MVVKRGFKKFALQVVAVFILPTWKGDARLSRVTVLAQPAGQLCGALEERGVPKHQRGAGDDLTSLPSRVARYLLDGGDTPDVQTLRDVYNRAVHQMKFDPRYKNWTIMRCFRLAMQEALQLEEAEVAPKEEGK